MTSDLSQTLKAGTLLIIETGEYSDKQWNGPVRMLGDYTKKELAELFLREWAPEPEKDWQTHARPENFLSWLVKSGKVEFVPAENWHVGCYGDFEP